MNDKTKEALEYIEDSLRFPVSDEVRGNLEKARDALATPPTDQTGLMIGEPLPCPFCGSEKLSIGHSHCSNRDRFTVACNDCGVETREHIFRVDAIGTWNRRSAPAVSLPSEEDIRSVFLKRGYTRTSFQDELVSDISSLLTDRLGKPEPSAVSMPNVEDAMAMADELDKASWASLKAMESGGVDYEKLTDEQKERVRVLREVELAAWLPIIQRWLANRLDKPVEVDFSHWAKTQGFDSWAADHAAVLRNLKAYLKSEGVRVKE